MTEKTYKQEAALYMDCMKDISVRIKNLNHIFSLYGIPSDHFQIEHVCAQLRIISETMFLSNYVANSAEYDTAAKSFIKVEKHDEVRRKTAAKNSHYYPSPFLWKT